MEFTKWLEAQMTLQQTLESLRVEFAKAAQKVYDEWEQGEDDDLNGGGICQDIADAIADVIYRHIPKVNAGPVSAACGEQHVWVMLHNTRQGFEIDVPYHIYERGGGYSWTKIPGVMFDPRDIVIAPVNRMDAKNALDSGW